MTTNQRIPAEAFPMTDFLKEELDERGWSQADLAKIIGKTPKDVHALVTGKVPLKPEMATLLGDAFGTGPEYWMNLETAYRGWLISRDTRQAVSRRGRLYEVAPVREIQKRGWIRPTDDVEILEREVLRFYGVPTVDALRDLQSPMAARTSAGYGINSPSRCAWAARARMLASAVTVVKKFSATTFADCLAQLRLLLNDAEEARHVPKVLAEHGIRFLVVEHLPHTKLDGACFWLDEQSPVVALSMRYERLDWFWFTLLHEMGHVKERDGLATGGVIDDALVGQDAAERSVKPTTEKAADAFAEGFLIPNGELDGFIARISPLYSKDRIRLFAKRINVHPALVVGQLQFRKEIEYFHSREMLRDKLRKSIITSALTDGWGNIPITL